MRNFGLSMALLVLSVTNSTAFGQVMLTIRHGKTEQPVTGLPFSADESVRIVQQLANGVTLSHEMKGRVYRSTQGVQRFEGTLVGTDPAKPQPGTVVWVVDPVEHTALSWNTNSKIATLTYIPADGMATVRFLPEPRASGSDREIQPDNLTTTDLGHQTRDKLRLVGKRVTGTIPVGKIGNEQPVVVTSDVWVSPALKLLVNEVNQDPRTGNRMEELTHIMREEPDATLFEVPAGYTLKEQHNLPTLLQGHPSVPVPDLQAQQIADARKDPGPALKNDVAYKLAMDKIDLSDAQSLAEQAVQMEEQQTANLDLKKADAEAFSQMTTLSRYWNTLGWVYFRQGKLAQAESYTRAAWELEPQGYFGVHLGRIYEEQNRLKDAITIYRMALSARKSPKEEEQIRGRLADLGVANAEPLPIAVPAPLPLLSAQQHAREGDALFDILLTHGNSPTVLFLMGSPTLKESAAAEIQATLHASLPDNGPEKVLRRARVICTGNEAPTCTLRLLSAQEAKVAGISLRN
jgi:tetratricopeptide (TPR) repeat protein